MDDDVNGLERVAMMKEIAMAQPDHDENHIGSNACCRKCYRMVLKRE